MNRTHNAIKCFDKNMEPIFASYIPCHFIPFMSGFQSPFSQDPASVHLLSGAPCANLEGAKGIGKDSWKTQNARNTIQKRQEKCNSLYLFRTKFRSCTSFVSARARSGCEKSHKLEIWETKSFLCMGYHFSVGRIAAFKGWRMGSQIVQPNLHSDMSGLRRAPTPSTLELGGT